MLTDTARNSTFYLHRLNRLDSLPQVVPLLTSGEVHLGHGNSFTGWESMLFKNFGQAAGCFVRRGYYPYRDWTKMTGVSKVDSLPAPEYYIRRTPPASLWRVYERFAQPILVMDNRDRGMSVILLDSVAAQRDTLYGRVITDRSFNRIGAFEIMVADTAVSTVDNSFLSGIEGKPVATKLAPDKVRSQHRSRWEKREDRAQYLTVDEQDAKELNLAFTGNQVAVRAGSTVLRQMAYRLHDTAPYLVVGDEDCDSHAYWYYELSGDSLTLRIPLRVNLEVNEVARSITDGNGKTITFPPSDWYFEEEWAVTYLVPKASGSRSTK